MDQIYTVTVKQDHGEEQFYGHYLEKYTKTTQTKAAFRLVDIKGAPAPVRVDDHENRKLLIRFFDAIAINQHNEARLFNTLNHEVDEKNCGTFVRVEPPLSGLSWPAEGGELD
ncbi:hypothetical protein [Castellaniella ginsengisoli]|uniref:Uncharacterized protein n=1 Tax=Castellaniella ginsengisoli TaxID=546114 RepID=A0AB39D7E8_9BURK